MHNILTINKDVISIRWIIRTTFAKNVSKEIIEHFDRSHTSIQRQRSRVDCKRADFILHNLESGSNEAKMKNGIE